MAGFFGIRDGVRLASRQIKSQLTPFHSCFMLGLVLFVGALGIAERMGLPRLWIGSIFCWRLVCCVPALASRAAPQELLKTMWGRCVPAPFDGMATGADCMSASSFIGLAGTLYPTGYNELESSGDLPAAF